MCAHHNGDEFATDETNARLNTLGISAFPTLIPDGTTEPSYTYSHQILLDCYNQHLAVESPCTLTLGVEIVGEMLELDINIVQDTNFEMPNPRLQIALTESHIESTDPNYEEFNFVTRDFYPDQNGTDFTMTGEEYNTTVSVPLDAAWDLLNSEVNVWVEDGSNHHIMQAYNFPLEMLLMEFPPPTNFVAVPGDLEVALSWDAPVTGTPTSYNVYRNSEIIMNMTNLIYTDTIEYDVQYQYYVTAIYATPEEESVPSNTQDILLMQYYPPRNLTADDSNGVVTLNWVEPESGTPTSYNIYRDNAAIDNVPELTFIDDSIEFSTDYTYYVTAVYNSNPDDESFPSNEVEAYVLDPAMTYTLIIDLDPTPTADILQAELEQIVDENVIVVSSFNEFPLGNASSVFILLGIYSNNYAISEDEAAIVTEYLSNGGRVYMEGGDTWAYDDQTSLHTMFNITGVSDGDGDLSNVTGLDFMDGMNWAYTGENNWIDQLSPAGDAVAVFNNTDAGYTCGIANDGGTYKTIGTSFEITGLGGENSLSDALISILNFFDYMVNEEDDTIPNADLSLVGNFPNPFNPQTKIVFEMNQKQAVKLEIFNIKGQKVVTLVDEVLDSGKHFIEWNGKDSSFGDVGTGIYLYKLTTPKCQFSKKMILLK